MFFCALCYERVWLDGLQLLVERGPCSPKLLVMAAFWASYYTQTVADALTDGKFDSKGGRLAWFRLSSLGMSIFAAVVNAFSFGVAMYAHLQ